LADEDCPYDRATSVAIVATQATRTRSAMGVVTARGKGLKNGKDTDTWSKYRYGKSVPVERGL
jgi:hypothetical protein